MTATLISIIGPPASGKTMLAEQLAAELPAALIREDYAGNPFLADSYVGSPAARLPAQLFFLMSRVKQLQKARWADEGTFVSDYGFCQDGIFARERLGESDLEIYKRVACSIPVVVHPPDLLICLDASVESLAARIAERGRSYETSMTREFLASMRAEYATVNAWAGCPVITVDTDAVDLRRPDPRAQLISALREKL